MKYGVLRSLSRFSIKNFTKKSQQWTHYMHYSFMTNPHLPLKALKNTTNLVSDLYFCDTCLPHYIFSKFTFDRKKGVPRVNFCIPNFINYIAGVRDVALLESCVIIIYYLHKPMIAHKRKLFLSKVEHHGNTIASHKKHI